MTVIILALRSVIGLEICVMGCVVQLGWKLCDGMGCVMNVCEIKLCFGLVCLYIC